MNAVERLRRERPRSRFLRWSLAAMGGLVLYAWFCGDIRVGDVLSERRLANLERFVTQELAPYPLRQGEGSLAGWAGGIMERQGWAGLKATLAISVLAIVLAGAAGLALCLPAARNFAGHEPFLPAGLPPDRRARLIGGAIVRSTRFVLLFLRSIPEFIWAYIFLVMFGATAWPAVLALAIHNAGILGRLNSEVVENLEPATLRSLRGLGATRAQIASAAIFPLALPRFLLYFFYRFETCVREATILGMAGIVSLGYYIQDARSKLRYDEMTFLILLGAAIVLAADLVSAWARRAVRRAS